MVEPPGAPEMAALFTLALLVGLDNVQVAAAIGLMTLETGRKWKLALAFGLCEGLMPLVGLLFGSGLERALGPWPEAVETVVLVGCGVAIIVLALREPDPERVRNGRWLLYGLPLSLSFDNLLAGVALATLGQPLLFSALVVGLVSTSLCLLGLFGAGWLRRWVSRRLPIEAGVLSGVFLVVLGLVR